MSWPRSPIHMHADLDGRTRVRVMCGFLRRHLTGPDATRSPEASHAHARTPTHSPSALQQCNTAGAPPTRTHAHTHTASTPPHHTHAQRWRRRRRCWCCAHSSGNNCCGANLATLQQVRVMPACSPRSSKHASALDVCIDILDVSCATASPAWDRCLVMLGSAFRSMLTRSEVSRCRCSRKASKRRHASVSSCLNVLHAVPCMSSLVQQEYAAHGRPMLSLELGVVWDGALSFPDTGAQKAPGSAGGGAVVSDVSLETAAAAAPDSVGRSVSSAVNVSTTPAANVPGVAGGGALSGVTSVSRMSATPFSTSRAGLLVAQRSRQMHTL